MKYTKEQQDYIKHCVEHFEVLTGGRGHSKTKELIEDMQKEITRLNNIIDELKWKPISQYDNGNYDWVLIKMFIKEDNYECVPIVAEKRMGVWENRDGETLDEDMFEIKYFMDMQQLDKLKELKENKI